MFAVSLLLMPRSPSTIKYEVTVNTVVASKQAELLLLVALHLLITLHAWLAHKLSCRAVQ